MASALSYLQGFNNTYLQGLSSDSLTAAIEIAALEVAPEAFGTTYALAVANLAAHNLLMEKAANDSGGGAGVIVGELRRRKVGPREEEYASTSGATSGKAQTSSDEFDRTVYGKRFKRLRDAVSFGMFSTGSPP